MRGITMDRSIELSEQPDKGHNRWHPGIPPVLEVAAGEAIFLETKDGWDGQVLPDMTADALDSIDSNVSDPLTGPVYIKEAEPGDLLEVELLEIEPEPRGWSAIRPGFGFLADIFKKPFLVHWVLSDGWATSPQIPGIRIPNGSFMGIVGVAPSSNQVHEWTQREAKALKDGGFALLPSPLGAVPASEPVASEGLRTLPPRENAGNLDIKQSGVGSRLLIPVAVKGALFSAGDGHFAQGDSECCGNAIEMGATVVFRFMVHKGEATRRNIRSPRISHTGYFQAPQHAVPYNFVGTIGMPIREDGSVDSGNIGLAARNALLNMIGLLEERGCSREQAYVICSVAVDLRISNLVDLPNVVVTALLPNDIF